MNQTKPNNANIGRGRPKGAQNIVTRQTKEQILKFVQDKLPELEQHFDTLPPQQKINTLIALLRFVVPAARDCEVEEQQNDIYNDLINRLFPGKKPENK